MKKISIASKTNTVVLMSPLDNQSFPKQLDPNNYLSHILEAPEQVSEGYNLGEGVIIPALYAQAKQVVILTVGELLPVALALEALMVNYARIPIVIVSDYILPHWVSRDTLVVGLDYSGTSEQVLITFREAAKQHARLLAVSVGGDLAREARRYRAPHISLSYGAPARIAFYYIFGCMTHIFKKLDLLEARSTTIEESAVLSRSLLENIGLGIDQYRNTAKQLAEKMAGRKTIIVGSGPLVCVAKKWQIELAATAKTIATINTLNEFNESIINGLEFQTKPSEAPLVIMLQSKYDHQRNKIQQMLTYQVAQAQKFHYEQIFMHPSGSLFGEIILSSLLGDMVSYYVAWLLNKDPSAAETTLFIKEHLSNQNLLE